MNSLLRELAPISQAAWDEIEAEAKRTLAVQLAARKLVDFSGPHGLDFAAVNTGRREVLSRTPIDGGEARIRGCKPLVEIRVPFELSREELDAVDRGAADPELMPLTDAARTIANMENRAVFHGYAAGEISGIAESAATFARHVGENFADYPHVVAQAVSTLRDSGIDGPYAIALGPRFFTGLTETATAAGYPVLQHVRRLVDGPIVRAPALEGAVVLSLRGGDFELTVGQDLSIGYLDHGTRSVSLYLQESFTFRVLTPMAAVPLTPEAALAG